MVSKNKLLHRSYGRLAKGGGRTRYEKRHGYATLFLSGSELSAPEKEEWSRVKITPSKTPQWPAPL